MHNYLMLFSKFGDEFNEMQCKGLYDSFCYIMQNIKRLPIRVAEEPVILTTRRILREIILKLEIRLGERGGAPSA